MIKVNIFIRKKANNYHHSIERFAKTLKKKNFKNLRINIIKCPLISKGLINRLYLIFWAYFNQADINHILGDINYISIFLKKNKTINTFLDCRLVSEFTGIKKYLYKLFWFRLPIKNSSLVTYISNFTRLEIEKKIYKKDKFSYVIPVPLTKNLSFRVNKNIKKKVLIIGTSIHKNIKNMILGLIGLNIELTIIGDINNEIKNLLKLNKINYKNFADIDDKKMVNVLIKNDILLMASTYEGFGMPIIEAQASGLAVVTSNLEPMKSVAGKNAVYVDPKNSKDIKKKISKLLNNQNYFLKIINNGRKNSLKYSSKIINNRYQKLYLKLSEI